MSDSLWPMDCSPPSSSAHGILQVRILEWVAISFSRRSSQPRDWTRIPHTAGGFFTVWTTREAQEYWSVCVCVCVWNHFSHVQLFTTLWTIVCQAPLSMGFSRQEYWSGFPFSSPGDLPNPGIEPSFLTSPALVGVSFTTLAPPGHQGSPSPLEWVAVPFCRGSSQSRDQTRVSFTAGIFFASWTTRDCSQDKAYQIVECLQERFL